MSTEPFNESAGRETPPAPPTSAAGTAETSAARTQDRTTPPPAAARPGPAPRSDVTRAGVVWVSVAVALVVLVALIIFILQNQDVALVHFLGFEGSVPVGMALFIAAVAGGVLVGIAGAVRITQLRLRDRRQRRA